VKVEDDSPQSSLKVCCPRCFGVLSAEKDKVLCTACRSEYPVISGIPDLRLPGPSWTDYEEDRSLARHLVAETAGCSAEEVIQWIYRQRQGWPEERVRVRTRQVLDAPDRLRRQFRDWLGPCLNRDRVFLDLGCGPGMLLAAGLSEGYRGIGIDVCLVWLVAAQKLIAEQGYNVTLAAALAESLPLPAASVGTVVSLDVIEHVANPATFLKEINRVTISGGYIAISTPNRYSLTAEPHVFLWGVGWLPRRLQAAYVMWRRHESYSFTRLLSTAEAARLVKKYTDVSFRILIPPVPDDELKQFPPLRARVARVYNLLSRWRFLRWAFLMIGPFFRIAGQKRECSS
jgi:SAM-dependent methyltransferase/uncharacterized protein YbaR (Trm112 family)